MATRRIVGGSDPILYKPSRDVVVFDQKLHQLLDDMAESMDEVEGVGLSAVQVGILRRACVIDIGDGLIEIINPTVTECSEETETQYEGCLSFPGKMGMVERPKRVKVRAQDRHGNLIELVGEDLMARALCHEIDHTNGIVFKDLASEVVDAADLEDDE